MTTPNLVASAALAKAQALEARLNALISGASAEPWNSMTLLNGWLNGGPAAQYRLNILGKLEIQGFITHASISGSSTFFTLPSGYYNPSLSGVIRVPMFAGFVTGWFYVSLDASGNLAVNASTAITQAQFDCMFSIA